MIYTLQDFLDGQFVPEIKLLTAPAGFDEIAVTTSRIQEPPFDEFFNKGELIITKVWGWEQDTKLMDDLVLIAHEKEVAALLWALHDKEPGIPASVIRLADNLAVPLFEIPWETSFADLQQAVFGAIQDRETEAFQTLQQALFDQFFEMSSLRRAASLIARELGTAVRITDRQGAGTTAGGAIPRDADPEKLYRADIATGDYQYGTIELYLSDTTDSPLRGHAEYVQKYIAFPLSFWFNRKNIEQITEARYRNDFVWDLATGSEASFGDLLAQGRQLGFDLGIPYLCAMLYLHFDNDDLNSDRFSRQLAQMTAGAEQAILEESQRRGIPLMTARVNQSFIVYIGNEKSFTERTLSTFLDQLEAAILQESALSCTFLWGISSTAGKDPGFAATYRQARQALAMGLHGKLSESRIFYRNTRRALIASTLAVNEHIKENAEEVFHDLLAYDNASKVGLMQTLMVYLTSNYNASKTAKELHLNRHSLLYRLDKIEQLTGLSLHEHEDLFVLEALAMAYEER